MHVSRFGAQVKGRARESLSLGFTRFPEQNQSARRQICRALTPKVSHLPPNPPKPPKTGGRGDRNSQPSNGSSIDKEAFHSFEPHETQHILILDISGMHCGGCASKVKRVLEQHELVTQANVNLATEVARITFILPSKLSDNAQNTSLSHEEVVHQLLGILKKNGFEGKVRDTSKGNSAVAKVVESRQKERSRRLKEAGWKVAIAWGLASVCILGHLPHFWHGAPHFLHRLASPQLHALLSAIAMLGPGRGILARGCSALYQNRPDMNSLVTLGASASFCVSLVATLVPSLGWPTFFEEPAMLLGCVLLGRALEERAKLAASSDLAALQHLIPENARLETDNVGSWKDVPTEALISSDVLVVLPGDRIAVDGKVISGISSANESALTGEPLPVLKSSGSSVTAGTLNLDGKLRIQVQSAGSSTTMADIFRLVESAQSRTAPVQRIADNVAGRFAVGVMATSALTLGFWISAGPSLFPKAVAAYCEARSSGSLGSVLLGLQMACNVLTIACPCALGLAAPTAVLVGTSMAARRGLLIRGGDILETASHLDTVVFDKTGTLTVGKPELQSVQSLSSQFTELKIMEMAVALEKESRHPLAQAVLSSAKARGIKQVQLKEGSCVQVPGSGISGIIEGANVRIGTKAFVQAESSVEEKPERKFDRLDRTSEASSSQTSDQTQMFLSIDGKLAGVFTIADQLRPDSSSTVAHLKNEGYQIHLLSGDSEGVAQKIAAQVGIPKQNVHASVSPRGKVELVEELQAKGRKVAMVGDGINDTGALAQANVGLAMGGGMDVASEISDIVLLGDRLPQVIEALEISKKTFGKIQQNLCWAFGYNLIGLPIAAGALLPRFGIALTPSMSGALMGLSSLAVMANSLTLHTYKPRNSLIQEPSHENVSMAQSKAWKDQGRGFRERSVLWAQRAGKTVL